MTVPSACRAPWTWTSYPLGMVATRESRPTKEYPKGQEVYRLEFPGDRAEA